MKLKLLIRLLPLILFACASPSTPADSGIEGQVLLGPMCPVVREEVACPDQPYQATLTVLSLNGRKIAQVQTNEHGKFKIPLSPGEYILHPEAPNVMPFAAEQTFVVDKGRFTQITVHYDSGIR